MNEPEGEATEVDLNKLVFTQFKQSDYIDYLVAMNSDPGMQCVFCKEDRFYVVSDGTYCSVTQEIALSGTRHYYLSIVCDNCGMRYTHDFSKVLRWVGKQRASEQDSD